MLKLPVLNSTHLGLVENSTLSLLLFEISDEVREFRSWFVQ